MGERTQGMFYFYLTHRSPKRVSVGHHFFFLFFSSLSLIRVDDSRTKQTPFNQPLVDNHYISFKTPIIIFGHDLPTSCSVRYRFFQSFVLVRVRRRNPISNDHEFVDDQEISRIHGWALGWQRNSRRAGHWWCSRRETIRSRLRESTLNGKPSAGRRFVLLDRHTPYLVNICFATKTSKNFKIGCRHNAGRILIKRRQQPRPCPNGPKRLSRIVLFLSRVTCWFLFAFIPDQFSWLRLPRRSFAISPVNLWRTKNFTKYQASGPN